MQVLHNRWYLHKCPVPNCPSMCKYLYGVAKQVPFQCELSTSALRMRGDCSNDSKNCDNDCDS